MRQLDSVAWTGRWKRRPAAEKLCLCLGVMTVSLAVAGPGGQVLIFALMALLTVGLAGVPFWTWLRALLLPAGFLVLGVLTLFVSVGWAEGEAGGGVTLALVPPTDREAAVFVGLRSAACVSALVFLALTTPLPALMTLLRRLGVPRDVADVALLMFRFLWLLFHCLETGRRSQTARLGYASRSRWLRSSALLAAGLLPRALDRGTRMDAGLRARGYDGSLATLSSEERPSLLRLGGIAGGVLVLGGVTAWIG
ncbi:cobalt ECF transporter T component CbiQ [Phaeovibrio sulfidiphilus]|uniref:Cobalt ECF transporter T component CbiQ n=1 Tax=Phaeovibrio sulfidiphilus TaxID=1220600 RepID=A0A8J6YL75_9PROT|nr:cobalt ECF transporter T component CbiQ [Phaeovibrio sulfidiphilus]MBE1236760.1 cobalt ECF transporter T component CbiQ [Phaeovibrio sulfidiphilus]